MVLASELRIRDFAPLGVWGPAAPETSFFLGFGGEATKNSRKSESRKRIIA